MRVLTVTRVTERSEDRGVFPSWPSLKAFYRAKPRVFIATVTLTTLPNLIWIIDRVT